MCIYTKLNFILGQSAAAEIHTKRLCGWVLVNTGWTNYKIQSVLNILLSSYIISAAVDTCLCLFAFASPIGKLIKKNKLTAPYKVSIS